MKHIRCSLKEYNISVGNSITEVHMGIRIHFCLISVSSQICVFSSHLEITLTVNIFNTKVINIEPLLNLIFRKGKYLIKTKGGMN